MLFAFRSGCSGAFTDVRAHLFFSPHRSHTSQAAATRVSIFVFYHDLICVFKASLSFGSAEQAHFLSLSPSSFLDDFDPQHCRVLAEFKKCECDVGLSLSVSP